MQITVYNFAKEPNSTKQPASGAGRTINCVLKEDCSMMSPVFLLDGWQTTDNYVKWGSRYFWIEDIIIKSADHAEYHCKEDVLASFKAAIGDSNQYILRSAHASDGNIIDMKYPLLTSLSVSEYQLTSIAGAFGDVDGGTYVIAVHNGTNETTGGMTYYALGPLAFRQLLLFMYGGSWLDLSETNVTVALQKELINPMQYIASVTWYPISMLVFIEAHATIVNSIKFGYWEATSIIGYIITDFNREYTDEVTIGNHIQATARGAYLNTSPFTQIMLYCFSFGSIPIDPKYFIHSHNIKVKVRVDTSTGTGYLIVLTGDNKKIAQYAGQVGIPMQISQITQSILNPISNTVSTIATVAAGNPLGAVNGIISAVESLFPQIQVSGELGSRIAYKETPRIVVVHHNVADDDNTHLGRPLCRRGIVKNYPGYMEVENADIEFVCNFSELEEIKSFMESGFYYE